MFAEKETIPEIKNFNFFSPYGGKGGRNTKHPKDGALALRGFIKNSGDWKEDWASSSRIKYFICFV